MDLILSKEQEFVKKTAREFAERELEPIAGDIDEKGEIPKEIWEKLARYNMISIPIPKEYGGAGGDYISYSIVVEEISKKCASTGVMVSGVASLFGWPILKFGTEEQKEKYLKPLITGIKQGFFALTEPNAGTDAASQQTIAKCSGDYYILNGSKCFITNGAKADFGIVFAMTDRSKGVKGISAFIVEKGFQGFTIGKHENKMGVRGTNTTELIFKDVKVPKENLLGKEGKGFNIAMATLDGGRIGVASQALGIAQGALDETVKYIKQRKQFGKPLSSFQGLQWTVSEMATRINAARWLIYDAADKKNKGLPYTKEAAMAKLYATRTAVYVVDRAVQLHGGYGYIKDYPVERMYRDAKITEIYEGTAEVQRMVIASKILQDK
ncbi:acyl-CoA dehydrogenase [Clostridium botulinum]|uniref:acyl-CoA dehydrogenase n=1 Tax=Clostridium botulinum TaxID=1491 RepID=UPI0003071EE0|nr:acyl-CoA dehydrogenase [Clostridium botulinum]KLU75145.1 acyl-CoA dehydrogenase [Clostridium botulinum V891]KOA73318.1 acyl-CoA dehydrogenase [Clostridium botulinum]KOA90099.1 acyl-CoA dehydrogenase [Clostridium botulinum]KOC36789.1 acyl-CoA dehydrogenase [Clostridium botulinum]MCD3201748.1 acyl-CoA dehydrogenase [Clostridium botulinum C/D]